MSVTFATAVSLDNLLAHVDVLRAQAYQQTTDDRRANLGQFFTPSDIARFMASMLSHRPSYLRILDPGAGVGVLTAACIAAACKWDTPPYAITVTAYEVDPAFCEALEETLALCSRVCADAGIPFASSVIQEDFIAAGVAALQGGTLFQPTTLTTFNCSVLNPPYRKLNGLSTERKLLRSVGIETSNFYTAFLWLAMRMLELDGELVSITPRSFCNGPYFRPFRAALLDTLAIRRVHIFDSRKEAFGGDDVLQENIIMHAVRSLERGNVQITSSAGPAEESLTQREISYDRLVQPNDSELFIHVTPNELEDQVAQHVRGLSASLADLHLTVSTGRVVDFRANEYLSADPGPETVPLLYPGHLRQSRIQWPAERVRKPQAITRSAQQADLLVPGGYYVLVKRFSSKEERRRVVAAVFDPTAFPYDFLGIENHLNYYHRNGGGLPAALAYGLAAFLNSTIVDQFFRQFSGHTQVNATDLRTMRYPNEAQLAALGQRVGNVAHDQATLDQLVREELQLMTNADEPDALDAKQRMQETLAILKQLGVPRPQQNDRSALTLLALLDVRPGTAWADASAPLRRITEMMDYMREHYGVSYAPNTRETVRRQTVHQFIQMGLLLENPDQVRPPNSPKTSYQVEASALRLLQAYGTSGWETMLASYLSSAASLRALQAKERAARLLPVTLPDGQEVMISGGGQNELIKEIVEKFCGRYTPGGKVVYLGDAGHVKQETTKAYLEGLGVVLPERSKKPDVIVHYTEKNWLVLIEAVDSHGPMDIKRHNELKTLFHGSSAPLVFVTAFPSRKAMLKYLSAIAWETEVWIAEEPTHLIHFNGERFLGPYE